MTGIGLEESGVSLHPTGTYAIRNDETVDRVRVISVPQYDFFVVAREQPLELNVTEKVKETDFTDSVTSYLKFSFFSVGDDDTEDGVPLNEVPLRV
jgi:hypothetical protein